MRIINSSFSYFLSFVCLHTHEARQGFGFRMSFLGMGTSIVKIRHFTSIVHGIIHNRVYLVREDVIDRVSPIT